MMRMKLSEWVKGHRLHLGWTQAELAHRADLATSLIGFIERGERDDGAVAELTIAKLKKAFREAGIDVDVEQRDSEEELF